jgi:hypothetical protein
MSQLILGIGYFLSSFLPWIVILYFVMAVVHLVRKKKFKEMNHKAILTVAIVVSILATIPFLIRNWESKPVAKAGFEKHVNIEDKLSIEDKKRFQEILLQVMQNPDGLNLPLRKEFWSIMEKSGEATPKSIEYLKDLMTGITSKYQRLFYEDAMLALNKGTPEKSIARENYEKHLLEIGAITDWRIKENERLIEKVAQQKPIPIGTQEIVLNEEMIKVVLSQLDVVARRIDTLYTNPN